MTITNHGNPVPPASAPAVTPDEQHMAVMEEGHKLTGAYIREHFVDEDDSPAATPEPERPAHVQAVMGRLRRWANRLRGRYGVPIYLCGSALRADNPDPRDWDVRIMLPDERFALAFGPVDEWRDEGCTGKWTRTRFRWSDQCVKDTQDFAAWCHLNGDVQIYPESHAATVYANEPRLRLDTFPDEGWTDHYDDSPAAPTGEEAETPEDEAVQFMVGALRIAAGDARANDDELPEWFNVDYLGSVADTIESLKARLTAQATELAALRARVKEADRVIERLPDLSTDGLGPLISRTAALLALRAALAPRQTTESQR